MDSNALIGAFALVMALVSGGVFFYYFRGSRNQVDMRSLMGGGTGTATMGSTREVRERLKNDETGEEYEKLKKMAKKKAKGKAKLTLEEKFFQAGIFSEKDKKEFGMMRLFIPCVTTPIMSLIFLVAGAEYVIYGAILGLLIGMQLPNSILDRRIAFRHEEILFFLPLVIEQIAIGVSSSLDIGPCLQRVVQMADERDSHNVCTEMLRHAQFHVKSGVSLEEALNEIGKLSGNVELKHAFMSLSQVSKHGGEISRQLQELADAVSSQRETKIDAKIKKLELEATGPVALVFMGFLIILLIGFGLQIQGAFN